MKHRISRASFQKMLDQTSPPDPVEDRLPGERAVRAEKDFIFDKDFNLSPPDYETGNPPAGGYMLIRRLHATGVETTKVLWDGEFGSVECEVET